MNLSKYDNILRNKSFKVVANANKNRNFSVYPHVVLHIQARSSLTVTRQIAEIFLHSLLQVEDKCSFSIPVKIQAISELQKALITLLQKHSGSNKDFISLKLPHRSLKVFNDITK
jgi:hypothetical protein